jgi:hypothetical protein
MKKITQESVENFSSNVNFHKSNTKILTDGNITSMYLFDNKIAYRIGKNLIIDNCGWKSNTTKERLNGLLENYKLPKIQQKKGKWFIDNEEFENTKQFILNIL